jgi:hypothetical protein
MDVHHPHHVTHKKKWSEYLLEFFMLFLAVFLGFVAENFREHNVERQRAKAYAQELYAELKSDSAVAANILDLRIQKGKVMDYLAAYFKDSSLTNLPKNFYPAYTISLYMINRYQFEPKDGVLSQLRSTGGLSYFKNAQLQKLLGDMSVSINNMRYRNDEEYQFFANPLKPFLLAHYDFNWLDSLRRADPDPVVLNVIKHYEQNTTIYQSSILNVATLDRVETCNMIAFFKQMMVSTQSLQIHIYIVTNHQLLQALRTNYALENG